MARKTPQLRDFALSARVALRCGAAFLEHDAHILRRTTPKTILTRTGVPSFINRICATTDATGGQQ